MDDTKSFGKDRNAALMGAIVLLSGLAGCVSSDAAPALSKDATDLDQAGVDAAALGGVVGRVFDDELRPISGANVTVEGTGLTSTSDEGGRFVVENVPVGEQSVLVDHPSYEPARFSVEVASEAGPSLEVRLSLLPSFVPRNFTHIFTGHYDCGHEIPIWTGDCLILYGALAGQDDTLTQEDFQFRFPVDAQWDSFVMELTWEYAANNQLDGMRFALEHVTNKTTDHSVKVGRTDGKENPLRFVVHRGEPHPRADVNESTGEPATFPVEGALAQVRVFPKGFFYDEMCMASTATTGDCFLGWGAGVDIRFTVFATVFYNGRAPEGFSAVAPTS